MAEIVLSKRDASTQKLQTMPRNVVESILQRLGDMKSQRIDLHGEWSEVPEYSQWLLEQLHANNFRVTVCTSSVQDLTAIEPFMEHNMIKELCLFKDDSPMVGEDFTKLSGLRFFLPVDTISVDGSAYRRVIDRIPPMTRVTLGVNWKSRLSGPEPIPEEDYQAWAETIVAIIDILSKEKISSTLGCGIKLCIFTKEQLGLLPNKLVSWPLASCNHSYFYDVDGTLTPCMRLGLPEKLKFNHETNLKEAAVAFVEWLTPYSGHCMESDDLSCRSLKTNGCSTGCLEHSEDEWQSS